MYVYLYSNMDALDKWLGITKQQMDILSTIIELQKKSKEVSPKDIISEYNRKYNKHLQKPNVFVQMRYLMELGIVKRISAGKYNVDSAAIMSQIKNKKTSLLAEVKAIDLAEDKVSDLSFLEEEKKPIVNYFGQDDTFALLADMISRANNFYMSTSFPGVSFTYPMYSYGKSTKYWLALNDFLKDGKEMYYITTLDATIPFWFAFNALNDKKRAVSEALATFENFRNQIKNFKNYHIGLVSFPFEPGQTILPEEDYPRRIVTLIRDPRRRVLGGISIESKSISAEYKKMFLAEFENSTKVTKSNVDAIVRKLKIDFKNKLKF